MDCGGRPAGRLCRRWRWGGSVGAGREPSPDVVEIQRVPFKVGVSSTTVEQLARAQACASEQGAGLITEPGPIEVYRMQCQDGKVFMARCELRQCRKM